MGNEQQELANYLNAVLFHQAYEESGEEIADVIINRFGFVKLDRVFGVGSVVISEFDTYANAKAYADETGQPLVTRLTGTEWEKAPA